MASGKGTIRVEIKKNDFKKKAEAYPKKVSVIVRKTITDIQRLADPETPIDTGFLRTFKFVEFSDNGTKGTIHWIAAYALYQEFGTRFIAPKLFATRAVAAAKPNFIAALKSLDV